VAIGPEFIAKLLPALDELEQRWRTGKISADKAIDFCLRCDQRLGSRPEYESLRQRVKVTSDAAWAARYSLPVYIRRDVNELERRWARSLNDNYRDDFEECNVLLARTAPGSPERDRVLAVLASVLDEATRAAADHPGIRDYLAPLIDRAAWERLAERSLPAARARATFIVPRKKPSSAKPTKAASSRAPARRPTSEPAPRSRRRPKRA
jgi:hypothetical protein